jgi:glucuronokinase
MIFESRAYARAGLLGNPSDGYFGKTISIIVRNFGAHVSLYESPELHIEQQDEDRNIFRNIYQLVEAVDLTGYYGGDRLVKATIKKFCEYCHDRNIRLHGKNFTIRYRSSIPRQVGLAGSSAIVAATMKVLMAFYEVEIDKAVLPGLILAVETDELGINAGLQDRVIQVYEGCVFMDFESKGYVLNNILNACCLYSNQAVLDVNAMVVTVAMRLVLCFIFSSTRNQ